jgi:predicted Rossmann fold flavoprotein
MVESETADVVIVGAGAAGLAAAAFIASVARTRRVVLLDGARTIGAKILVSGGGRCNVTNRVVNERDFWGGDRRVIRNVLRAFDAGDAATLFAELGVPLHEEEDGKLFPNTNDARTVLEALIRAVEQAGGELRTAHRVSGIQPRDGRFTVRVENGMAFDARVVVLATGGRSLPKSGSDGAGYAFAQQLGHGYVETTPALVPLLLDDHLHAALAGVSHPAAVVLRVDGKVRVRLEGPMLWTHVGISGPVVLNASRHWLRARLDGDGVDTRLSVLPDQTFESLDVWLQDQRRERPRATVRSVLASRLPASVADVWLALAGVEPGRTLAHLERDERRALVAALIDTPLRVRDSRGYNYAEVTAGGVPLTEVDAATMESRVWPGLFLIGEILDVDGRLGGFNFQWAWSSAWVAAQAIAKRMPPA